MSGPRLCSAGRRSEAGDLVEPAAEMQRIFVADLAAHFSDRQIGIPEYLYGMLHPGAGNIGHRGATRVALEEPVEITRAAIIVPCQGSNAKGLDMILVQMTDRIVDDSVLFWRRAAGRYTQEP